MLHGTLKKVIIETQLIKEMTVSACSFKFEMTVSACKLTSETTVSACKLFFLGDHFGV